MANSNITGLTSAGALSGTEEVPIWQSSTKKTTVQAIANLAGASSPLTTKGDLYGYSTGNARIPVGTNGQVLTADSAEALGVKWATVSGAGDVVGPASATDNAIGRFDGTTGKLIQDSSATIDDSGNLTANNISGTNTGDQNLFSTIAVSGQSDVVADSTTDTLTLVAGSNITITTNASTDSITISASGGGGAANLGTAVIDFGAFPGNNEATVTVTGQTGIGTSNVATASFRRATTSDHTINDHDYAAMLASLVCSVPTAGTGFDIVARCAEKLQGTFNVNWQWT